MARHKEPVVLDIYDFKIENGAFRLASESGSTRSDISAFATTVVSSAEIATKKILTANTAAADIKKDNG